MEDIGQSGGTINIILIIAAIIFPSRSYKMLYDLHCKNKSRGFVMFVYTSCIDTALDSFGKTRLCVNTIQTHTSFKRTPFIRTKSNTRIFGVIRLITLQNAGSHSCFRFLYVIPKEFCVNDSR